VRNGLEVKCVEKAAWILLIVSQFEFEENLGDILSRADGAFPSTNLRRYQKSVYGETR